MMIEYYVMDPTGNVTILVTTPVPVDKQPEIALSLMKKEPQAEQVGFVCFRDSESSEAADIQRPDVILRMAGGEFCGNATMCAAALFLHRTYGYFENDPVGKTVESALLTEKRTESRDAVARSVFSEDGNPVYEVRAAVSGAPDLLKVRMTADSSDLMRGTVDMPMIESVEQWEGPCTGQIVNMPGITHLITEQNLEDERAEKIVRQYAYEHELDAVGLMQIDPKNGVLKPLVFVETADTLYWEHSCASGTSAAGAALAVKAGEPVIRSFREPGGILKVEAWPEGKVHLTGQVRLIRHIIEDGVTANVD